MKVLCINNKVIDQRYKTTEAKNLQEGTIYTVIGEAISPNTGDDNYILEEVRSTNPTGGFKAKRFVPLSDIDEKEFERNYNKQLA